MGNNNVVRVGVGVIIINNDGHILIGKRKGSHAPHYSIPGGKVDLGETFEACAIREIKEETNLDIQQPKVIGVINDLKTYQDDKVHFISIILVTKNFSGDLKVMEPKKCDGWQWVDPKKLPLPHFNSSQQAVKYYLKNIFYQSNN